jgi:hypothetical protein
LRDILRVWFGIMVSRRKTKILGDTHGKKCEISIQ